MHVVYERVRRVPCSENTNTCAMIHMGAMVMLSIDDTGADAGDDRFFRAPLLFAQLCPRASEAACADLAYSLAREGRVVLKGMSKGREVERGKGWIALHPGFFVHDIVGGVFRNTGLGAGGKGWGSGGVVSATVVCEAVIG